MGSDLGSAGLFDCYYYYLFTVVVVLTHDRKCFGGGIPVLSGN